MVKIFNMADESKDKLNPLLFDNKKTNRIKKQKVIPKTSKKR